MDTMLNSHFILTVVVHSPYVNIIVAFVFLLLGAASAVGGFFLFRSSYRKVTGQGWEMTTGTVVGYIEHSTRNRVYLRPQVQFTDPAGKLITFASSTGSGGRRYRIGASVKVLYSQKNPEDADLKSFATLWFPLTFPIILVVVFWGGSLLCFWFELHKH
jgi:hypothetical protein